VCLTRGLGLLTTVMGSSQHHWPIKQEYACCSFTVPVSSWVGGSKPYVCRTVCLTEYILYLAINASGGRPAGSTTCVLFHCLHLAAIQNTCHQQSN
jgi:hypothetical protein